MKDASNLIQRYFEMHDPIQGVPRMAKKEILRRRWDIWHEHCC